VTVDMARAAVISGDGVVARYPGVLCVARSPDRDALLRLLEVCATAAGPDPGRTLARRLARWMGSHEAPGDDLEFGILAGAGDQLGVFLVGSVAVVVPGGSVALSGSDAATWTDRLIPQPDVPVVLALDGVTPPAGLARGINDLRAGVVPGAGAVLFPIGRGASPRPEPARPDGRRDDRPGDGYGIDGPTIRTPAHNGGAANGAGRNGGARNGSSPQLANGAARSAFDDGAVVEGPRGRPGARVADSRSPNGYEWFADWTGHGAPPGPADAPRWPWTDSPAATNPGENRDADPEPRAPDAERGNGAAWAEAPTPPGGHPHVAGPGDPGPVWIDPAGLPDGAVDRHSHVDRDSVLDNAPGTNGHRNGALRDEGRHAITGEPGGVDAPEPPDTPDPNDDGRMHSPAADPVPAPDAGATATDATDDHTPVTAVAAVRAPEAVEVEDPAPVPDEARIPEPEPVDTAPADALPADVVPVDEMVTADPDEAWAPTPAPRPQEAVVPDEDVPDEDDTLVRGRLCAEGHLNDPRAMACARCGSPTEDGEDVVGPRPPLGRIVFDDGAVFTVDAGYLVGRMPEADARARTGELQPIVVEDRSGSVSRVHAEILINGWDVVLVDSGSRNGTFVAGPDEDGWTPLSPGRTSVLLPGTRVRMGGRTFLFEPTQPVG